MVDVNKIGPQGAVPKSGKTVVNNLKNAVDAFTTGNIEYPKDAQDVSNLKNKNNFFDRLLNHSINQNNIDTKA